MFQSSKQWDVGFITLSSNMLAFGSTEDTAIAHAMGQSGSSTADCIMPINGCITRAVNAATHGSKHSVMSVSFPDSPEFHAQLFAFSTPALRDAFMRELQLRNVSAAPGSTVSTHSKSPASCAVAAVSTSAAHEFPRLGMTVRRLGQVIDSSFLLRHKGRQALAGLTTSEVTTLIFAPATAASKLSLCEQLQGEGDAGIGIATWFVSHAWMCTFVELLEALEHFFGGEPQGLDTCIWLDLVSTSQHGTFSRPPEWWNQTFIGAVQSMGKMVMVMEPWDTPVTLTRAWCVLELYACFSSGCRFEVALPQAQRAHLATDLMYGNEFFFEFLADVRSESNECSLATDRDGIFAAIRASVGFAGLDLMVSRTLGSWMMGLLQGKIDRARAASNDEESAEWINALGVVYFDRGMHEEALCLFEEAAAIGKRVLQPDDEYCLAYTGNLTNACVRSGDCARAVALQEDLLAAFRRVFGSEHEYTLALIANLADVCISMGDLARGLPLSEEVLGIHSRVLGDEHQL